jgi:uncharacterized protein (TIGR00251 family)
LCGRHPDGALEIWVKAPPEGGKANAEVIALLARALGVRRDAVELVTGTRSRHKVVKIHGLAAAELTARLDALLAAEG